MWIMLWCVNWMRKGLDKGKAEVRLNSQVDQHRHRPIRSKHSHRGQVMIPGFIPSLCHVHPTKSKKRQVSILNKFTTNGEESLALTHLGINIPKRNAARRAFMKTVIFSARGLLPNVMS